MPAIMDRSQISGQVLHLRAYPSPPSCARILMLNTSCFLLLDIKTPKSDSLPGLCISQPTPVHKHECVLGGCLVIDPRSSRALLTSGILNLTTFEDQRREADEELATSTAFLG